MTSRKVLAAITIVGLLSLAGIVYAVFTQTIPQLNIPGQFTLTPCSSSLTEVGAVTPGSGTVMFDCSGSPAFTVAGTSGSAIPTFTIPTSPSTITANLGITINGSCTSFTGLINNSPTVLAVGGYDYCLQYSNVPTSGGTIGPITISWT